MSVNISKVEVFTFENEKITFDHFKGKILLIVNVASKCGFTKQYKALQQLQDQYESKGFSVLGFPCNDFGNQEPGELEEIKKFCSISYGANFQLFQKMLLVKNPPHQHHNQRVDQKRFHLHHHQIVLNKLHQIVKKFQWFLLKIAKNNAIGEKVV